jgi:beta-glucosidase
VKDPRWGRSQEVYSEDPRLSSALTMGYVTGIQGASYNATQKDPHYMQAGACCKHYVAYDLEGNGGLPSRVYFDARVDTRSFWEHYMPVFHDCIVTARGMHAMCSYRLRATVL